MVRALEEVALLSRGSRNPPSPNVTRSANALEPKWLRKDDDDGDDAAADGQCMSA